MFTIEKTFSFDAAHFLPRVPAGHKCRRMHGHTYSVTVRVRRPGLDDAGMVLDYGELSGVAKPLVESLDHRVLNEIEGLENPTAEVISQWVYDRLYDAIPGLDSVVVKETPATGSEYRRNGRVVNPPFAGFSAEARRLYFRGMTCRQVADEISKRAERPVSASQVAAALRAYGIYVPDERRRNERRRNADDFQERVHAKRGHWMYPFDKVKQESGEGWFIDWLERPEGIPIDKVEIGDAVADWSLNETIYWKVRDVDVDHGRIWLDAVGKNPFLTGVGAGGAKLSDWDWKALTGEAHQAGVDMALRWVESGCRASYSNFTKLLKGIVATQFGPNGAQGGWYNAHDTANVGSRQGMSESEIVEWDARALQRLGLDVPKAALRGELDAYTWTQFVNGSDEVDAKSRKTLLDGEDWDDVDTVVRFILEHPMSSIKLRNWKALRELWQPYYRRIVERETAPARWEDPAWVERYKRVQEEVEARWQAGEYEQPELESVVRRIAAEVANLHHPRCEEALQLDPYWNLKEQAINLAKHMKWPEVLLAHERAFDETNRKYVAWAWGKLKDADALLRMEAVETHPEALGGILHGLRDLGVDVLPLVDGSPDRYGAILARVGENSGFAYHAKELAQFVAHERLRRERKWNGRRLKPRR